MSDVPNWRHSVSCWRHVATRRWSCRRVKKISCRLESLNDTTFDDMSGNSRHVGNFLIVVWAQTQKLYGRVANSYVWADLYLSAVIDRNWVCRGLFCVATTRNVGQDLATFGDVGDMSATRRRHNGLSIRRTLTEVIFLMHSLDGWKGSRHDVGCSG